MERNAFFDNAKILLIFFVVFGHLLQQYTSDSRLMNTLYIWIYTFHMPAFIFLAGFFAKGLGNKKYIINLSKKLLLPYLVFQLLYTGYYFLIGKEGWQKGIFDPQWSLWFLFSLFCWHILLTIFKKLPPKFALILAVILGLGIGYFNEIGQTLSFSRTFVFFPFFLIGFLLQTKHIMLLKQRYLQISAVFILLGVAVMIYYMPNFDSDILLASKSYTDLELISSGGIVRTLVYMLSAIMMASVFALVSNKHSRFTKLGTRTLYVYLLHGFFIQYFRTIDIIRMNNVMDLLFIFIVSLVIIAVLTSKFTVCISEPLIECRASVMKRLFHQRKSNSVIGDKS